MASFALDTNCLVAAVCTWHEHHEAAAGEIERRLARRERLVTPGPALVEAYAVLTRLPAPHRLTPADAWTLLRANFVDAAVLAAPTRSYPRFFERLVRESISGGRVYDLAIAESAVVGGADVLLTFNRRHFESPAAGIPVEVPAV